MSTGRHTQTLDPVTQEVPYGWVRRPDPSRRPRDWRNARNAAWTVAGYACALAWFAVAFLALRLAVGR